MFIHLNMHMWNKNDYSIVIFFSHLELEKCEVVSSEALLTYNASGHHCKSIPLVCSPLVSWRRQRETYHSLFPQGLIVSYRIWSTCTHEQMKAFCNKGINTDGYYCNIWRQKDNQLRRENMLKYKGGNVKHVLKPPKILD